MHKVHIVYLYIFNYRCQPSYLIYFQGKGTFVVWYAVLDVDGLYGSNSS